jgi:hypothetical protein
MAETSDGVKTANSMLRVQIMLSIQRLGAWHVSIRNSATHVSS